MKKEILDLLKTKFVGVSEITLNRMAEKAAKTVTTEELVTSYIDGITFQTVIDSEADYRATKASQTSVENYEKKYNIKEGKAISQGQDEPDQQAAPAEGKDDFQKKMLAFMEAYENDKKAIAAVSLREKVIAKIIELGASDKDKKHIESLVDMAGVNDSTDVEAKAASILEVYNSFKKPEGGGTPATPDINADVDKFEQMLKDATE